MNDLATERIFSRLNDHDINNISVKAADLSSKLAQEWRRIPKNSDRWKALTLRLGTHFVAKTRTRTLLSTHTPSGNIHLMQRGEDCYVGDMYSANMVLEALNIVKQNIGTGKNYLDFGCSSGSLARIFAAYEPSASIYGVDPVENSIDWADTHLKSCNFSVSPQVPPMGFGANFFSGVTAISIWSHFSERAALAWFDEMHRVIHCGGWLFFTTHGIQAIESLRNRKTMKPERIDAIHEEMQKKRYHYEDMFGNNLHYGLETADWGNSYFLPDWLLNKLIGKWELEVFLSGRNQRNQDCYLLKRI